MNRSLSRIHICFVVKFHDRWSLGLFIRFRRGASTTAFGMAAEVPGTGRCRRVVLCRIDRYQHTCLRRLNMYDMVGESFQIVFQFCRRCETKSTCFPLLFPTRSLDLCKLHVTVMFSSPSQRQRGHGAPPSEACSTFSMCQTIIHSFPMMLTVMGLTVFSSLRFAFCFLPNHVVQVLYLGD